MEVSCLVVSLIFYLMGLLTPFLAETFRFINFLWKDYIRNRKLQDQANARAKSQLAARQLQVMKTLVNGGG